MIWTRGAPDISSCRLSLLIRVFYDNRIRGTIELALARNFGDSPSRRWSRQNSVRLVAGRDVLVRFPTPPALLSFQYKWVTQNSAPLPNVPFSASLSLSQSLGFEYDGNHLVSNGSRRIKTRVFVLRSLSKVLAAPGDAVVELGITNVHILTRHNEICADNGTHPLTWGGNLEAVARLH